MNKISFFITCGLPLCAKEKQPKIFTALRITLMALAIIALLIGILILCNIFKLNQWSATSGWITCSVATLVLFSSVFIKCVKNHDDNLHTKRIIKNKNKNEQTNNLLNNISSPDPTVSSNQQRKSKNTVLPAMELSLPHTLPHAIPPDWDIQDKKWLRSEHLHLYAVYLATQYPEMAIQEPADTFNIISLKKDLLEYLLPEINKIYGNLSLPVFLHVSNNHWTLVYIDRQLRTVEYYDSKKDYGNYHKIVKELKKITECLSRLDPNQEPYKFINKETYKFVSKIDKQLQPDGYQCGIWTLYFLEYRLKNPVVNFNELDISAMQIEIANFRLKVQKTLIKLVEINVTAYEKAKSEYKQLYKDPLIAEQKFQEERAKISYLEAWRQILNGQFLTIKS